MKIAVIGVGTAGIMSLCHTLKWMCPDDGSTITSIYDPSVKILGIGETSQPNFVKSLFEGANFNFLLDAHELDATVKFGASYKKWRETNFDMPMEPPSYGIHFNNFKLKDFCFKRFNKLWGDKFKVVEGKVVDVINRKTHAEVIVNNFSHHFDYVIDCRGYPSDLTDYVVLDDLTVNHCLVNIIDKPGTWNTSINQATSHGWMFGIPLSNRQGWGYLYNDKITTREEAVSEIESLFGIPNPKLNEFTFKSYYAKTFFDGRILKNGNRAFFFEPIEGMAGFFYDTTLRFFVDHVAGRINVDVLNENLSRAVKDIENFIYFLYQGGSTFDSKFWNITKEKCARNLRSKTSHRWRLVLLNIKKELENPALRQDASMTGRWSPDLWVKWAENLEYDYFKDTQ
jgi:tryptophan halogenase